MAPVALGPRPPERRAQEREREPRPEREVGEPHLGEDGMAGEPAPERGVRHVEARIDGDRRRGQEPARGPPAQERQNRCEHRWDEAAGLSLDVVAYPAPQAHLRGQRRREERSTMDHIGMDVHKKERQICILAEGAS